MPRRELRPVELLANGNARRRTEEELHFLSCHQLCWDATNKRLVMPRRELRPVEHQVLVNCHAQTEELHFLSCVPALLDATKNMFCPTMYSGTNPYFGITLNKHYEKSELIEKKHP